MKRILKWGLIAFAGLFVIGIIGALSNPKEQKTTPQASTERTANLTPTPQAQPTTQAKSPTSNATALDQMTAVFVGNPSKEEIKDKLDRAMQLYGLEITEDNYNRAENALVSLRKASKTGVTEMAILDYMIRSYADNAKMSFPDMAGLAAAVLEKDIDK